VGEPDVSARLDAVTPILLEAYVESVDQVLAAIAAGADRIELCGPGEGGLTPSDTDVAAAVARAGKPVHVMIRPRTGDFAYTPAEFAVMRKSVAAAVAAGAAGVVFGILRANGRLDEERMAALVEASRPLRVICHRAFDRTPDADDALEALIALGADGVLTSGHAETALEGALTIARHVEAVAHHARPFEIMAGGGVRASNVRAIVSATGVTSLHARATDPAVIGALARELQRH
jgi:copper homeostasis protein